MRGLSFKQEINMAGTLEINEHVIWMPAGWAYDFALELIAAELKGGDPGFAHRVLLGRTETGGYLDLRLETNENLQRLELAAGQALEFVVSKGKTNFYNPAFFDGFVAQLEELVRLVREDLRVRRERGAK
ncbi:MAG: hypothetical protein IT581_00995 [Verrucomicrobiales bacterium]|nr:hypothetical protein [Verrucomicrobiales bacterium]